MNKPKHLLHKIRDNDDGHYEKIGSLLLDLWDDFIESGMIEERVKMGTPTIFSNSAICFETAAWVMFNSSATRANSFRSDNAAITRKWLSFPTFWKSLIEIAITHCVWVISQYLPQPACTNLYWTWSSIGQ